MSTLANRGVEFGIDWLTMTTTSPKKGDVYWQIMLALTKKRKPWRFRAFVGLSSVTDDVSCGIDHSTGTAILIARGSTADRVARAKPPPPSQVSRIDLQGTLALDKPDATLVKRLYEQAEGSIRKKSFIENSDGGVTTYLGSRHSTKFIRIYDAGVKHGLAPAGNLIRFEVEIKKPLALQTLEQLYEMRGSKQVRRFIATNVTRWLAEQNIGALWTDEEIDDSLAVSLRQRVEREDKTFVWLSTQVNAAIEKMLKRGYTREELEAVLFPPASSDREF